jgi:hypothetical protein
MQYVFIALLLDFSVQETIERYQRHVKESNTNKQTSELNMEVILPFSSIKPVILSFSFYENLQIVFYLLNCES